MKPRVVYILSSSRTLTLSYTLGVRGVDLFVSTLNFTGMKLLARIRFRQAGVGHQSRWR